MPKENKCEYMLKLFHYWCGKLNVPYPIKAIRDNRQDTHLAVSGWGDGSINLIYNTKKLSRKPKCVLIGDIFHEISHIKNNLPYRTEKQMEYSEYRAEKDSLKLYQKYYPKQYKVFIKRFKKRNTMEKLRLEEPIYYRAFSRIKEYKC